ncbi:cobyrinate a,c-diamide synthase [Marinobacterium arenosum]|uniref:cobyrinate a,c-diamide synthase n=1 Tax=Marinobacterium arenosum TaxID=2862496 RepID=UPI001C942042|nr:cobyrinate a,c-diamide synthase [Marinobacterium arenosum]MBY4676038.1 cobyrinate a,c-diamide synthase [Marinobacterium arenosum]
MTNLHARCPALMIGAAGSGQGKTLLTAALARLHRRAGRKVQVFKCGPDFLDGTLHRQASGQPVYNLDLWMLGEAQCRRLLAEAAADNDLLLIEGVMGLYDGNPSSADLAATFQLPLAAVIDAQGLAQTFAALAHGLHGFRDGLNWHGVIANRVGSGHHVELLQQSLSGALPLLAALPRDARLQLPERHLGLVNAAELAELDAQLDIAAELLADSRLAQLPPAVDFRAGAPLADFDGGRPLAGKTIAIAEDLAFSFIYRANRQCLIRLGAELVGFSPLADQPLPACDALWLPGGYPELHAALLSGNHRSRDSIRTAAQAGLPILAECGGLLYLLDSLQTADGEEWPMCGLLRGRAAMQPRFQAIGLQQLSLDGQTLRGHSFHHSRLDTDLPPLAHCIRRRNGAAGEPIYRHGAITASYLHGYFDSAPQLVADIFNGELAG